MTLTSRFAGAPSGEPNIADTRPEAKHGELAGGSTDYVRFFVLAGARTGSNMLVQALNSSPRIRCFGEIFNADTDFIPFGVESYDNFDAKDRMLRDRDPAGFLRERIFCKVPEGIGAVGFKLLHGQNREFQGLIQRLILDREIRVLRLKRRSLLRRLASWKIAESTGVWAENRGMTVAGTFTPANAWKAAQHPLWAVASLRRRFPLIAAKRKDRRAKVTLSVEECSNMFRYMENREAHFDNFFRGHPSLALFYEDVIERPDEAFSRAQSFLDVEPAPLTVTSRRQNPGPLRDLLENYDELHDAFHATPYAAFFE